jgi:hypothetical protein
VIAHSAPPVNPGNVKSGYRSQPVAFGCADRQLFRGGADQITQNRSGLDRSQLIRITDKDHAGIRVNGIEQLRHHRERYHRHLVDDDGVMRERIARRVAEPSAGEAPSEQPVQCGSLERFQTFPNRRRLFEAQGETSDLLRESGGGLPGRRRHGDDRKPTLGSVGLVEQSDQPGNRVGLAGARSAGNYGQTTSGGHCGRKALEASYREQIAEDPGDFRQGLRRSCQPEFQVGQNGGLIGPVTLEVQERTLYNEWPARVAVAHEGACLHGGQPGGGFGPGKRVDQVHRYSVDGHRIADCRKVDAHVPETRSSHSQGGRQQYGWIDLSHRPANRERRVDVDWIEYAHLVECAEEIGRLQDRPEVGWRSLEPG